VVYLTAHNLRGRIVKKKPERFEDVIDQFCEGWARTNPRPRMKDKATRSMFSVELARAIRKYAKVTRIVS